MIKEATDRRDKMQRLNNRPQTLQEFEDDEQARILVKGEPVTAVQFEIAMLSMTLIFLIVVTASAASLMKSCSKPVPVNCTKCHAPLTEQQKRLSEYFKKNGAKTPEMLATACLETKSPRLMAAITKKEGMNPKSRKGGYKQRHHGAWQVNPTYWGKVSSDPILQARQSEAILEELVEKNNGKIKVALNAYGGDTRGRYAEEILRELKEVPK